VCLLHRKALELRDFGARASRCLDPTFLGVFRAFCAEVGSDCAAVQVGCAMA